MKLADELLYYFEDVLPKYYNSSDIRTQQVQMAIDIYDFFNSSKRRILIIEAPVGTGKSLGVLIPAALHRKKKKQHIVYATSTINLQGQLIKEEIPLLKKFQLINQSILAKGKSHYYCHRQYMKKQKKYKQYESELKDFYLTSKSGQRHEFEEKYSTMTNAEWEGISLTGTKKDCTRCEYVEECPTYSHRNNFCSISNDIVVTNHDQLITSVLIQTGERNQSPIVPITPGIIIIDEAHDFQENFLGRSEQSITLPMLQSVGYEIPYEYRNGYFESIRRISGLLKVESSKAESLQGRYPISEDILENFGHIIEILKKSLTLMIARGFRRSDSLYDDDTSDDVNQMIINLSSYFDDKYVSWISYEEYRFTSISRKFPGEFRRIIENMCLYNKIIFMSGTLTTNKSFDPLLKQWRLKEQEVITKCYSTSFSYDEQAKILIPDGLIYTSNMAEPAVMKNKIDFIKQLLNITNGRTLILCTAKMQINMITKNIENMLSEKNIMLLKQGDSGVETLTTKFKDEESSVLVGSGSFFSGFSVPGKALISVILTKLPFPVPDDPYLKLIGEGYEDDLFNVVYFPNMMTKLNQAIGRLIRDIKDYGIITILDPRIYIKDYGIIIKDYLKGMGYGLTREIDVVTEFLHNKDTYGSAIKYKKYTREDIIIPTALLEDIENEQKNAKHIEKGSVKIKTERKKLTKVNEITEQQIMFCNEICSIRNIDPPKLNKYDAKSLYEYLYNLFYQKRESPEIVVNKFPYISEDQKNSFSSFKGSGVVTYRLSDEEMAKYMRQTSR